MERIIKVIKKWFAGSTEVWVEGDSMILNKFNKNVYE